MDLLPLLQQGITWLPCSGSQVLPAAPSLSVVAPVGANTPVGMAVYPCSPKQVPRGWEDQGWFELSTQLHGAKLNPATGITVRIQQLQTRFIKQFNSSQTPPPSMYNDDPSQQNRAWDIREKYSNKMPRSNLTSLGLCVACIQKGIYISNSVRIWTVLNKWPSEGGCAQK